MPGFRALGSSLALVVAAAACGGGEVPRRNVLLVTLDTTRADRLGCYGYEAARTPRLDGLARRGVVFERAYAHVPLTLPSHATLMTGVHPRGTGLHTNFQGALPDELPTLAEAFAQRGYRTAGFVAAWVLDREFGLARGFQRYEDLSGLETREDRVSERRGDEVVDGALAWLAEPSERPFFAWVHLFDPHDPYEPPEGFDVGQPYDGEIAFVDHQIGRLLDGLEASGELESTFVVVLGDHGESLGEHGEATHGLFLYDATMRVPLIVAGPPPIAPGIRVTTPVGLVDVAPTVLGLMGWPAAATIEGRDLGPALTGQELPARPVHGESEYGLSAFAWAPLFALVTGDWKYVAAPAPELYDLARDPAETRDVAGSEPERAARMDDALQAAHRAGAMRNARDVQLGSDASAHISALGYIGGTRSSALRDLEGLRDPKGMTHVLAGVMRAKALVDAGRHAEAAEQLAPLLEDSPESDEVWSLYGTALLALERYAEAERALAKSLRIDPRNASRLVNLGDAQRRTGQPEAARKSYEAAIASEPGLAKAHGRLGFLDAGSGRIDTALVHMHRFVELEPASANAHTNLANVLFVSGDAEAGLRAVGRALECDPGCLQAHDTLIGFLLGRGRRAEAIQALRRAVRGAPGELRFGTHLAWLLAVTDGAAESRPGEALELARASVAAEPGAPRSHDVLGAALAAAGDFDGARFEAERAAQLAADAGLVPLEQAIRTRIERYRTARPWRE